MISYLKGRVLNKGASYVIIKVGDIGYQVFINQVMQAEIDPGQELEFYIHQYVREDSLDLYGFKSMEELEMFEMLLSISGIGPKSALGVLSIASVADIKETITQGDPSLLTKVSGIGKKTAERVVLELRGKIKSESGVRGQESSGAMASADEIDALMALGYSMSQARDALRGVDSKTTDSGERIKQALKKLGK